MAGKLTGKVVIVTGASSGIGAATAKTLADAGATVVGIARRAHLVEELSKKVTNPSGKIVAKQCDVTNSEQVEETYAWIEKEVGGVDVIINNVGMIHMGRLTALSGEDKEVTMEQIIQAFNSNVIALIHFTKLGIRSMTRRGVNGHILQMSSVFGHWVPTKCMEFNVLAATKFAITALNETLLQEVANAKSKIKVTTISPGVVKTYMSAAADSGPEGLDLSCHLNPEDVADAVMYAVSTPPHVNIQEIVIRPVGEVL